MNAPTPPAQSGMLEKLTVLRDELVAGMADDPIGTITECIAIEQQRASQQSKEEEAPDVLIARGRVCHAFALKETGLSDDDGLDPDEQEQYDHVYFMVDRFLEHIGGLPHPKEPTPAYLSRDYKKLWPLLCAGKEVRGIIDDEVVWLSQGTRELDGRGIEAFIASCEKMDLEWVSPHPIPSVLSREVVEKVVEVVVDFFERESDALDDGAGSGLAYSADHPQWKAMIARLRNSLESLSSSPAPTQKEP